MLVLAFVLVSLVPIVVVGAVTFFITQDAITQETLNELESLAIIQEERINEIIDRGSAVEEDEIIAVVSGFTGNTLTGEMLLARRNSEGAAEFLHERRFEYDAGSSRIIPKERTDVPITQALLQNEGIFTNTVDYRNVPVLSATRYIERKDWGLVVKVDKSEAFKPINRIRNLSFMLGIIAILFASGAGFFVSRRIAGPLKDLTKGVDEVSKGNFELQLNRDGPDEIVNLTESLARILASLKLAVLRTGITKGEMGISRREVDVKKREGDVGTRETDVTAREDAMTKREGDVGTRETDVTAREDAMTKREGDVGTRETDVTAREDAMTKREEIVNQRKLGIALSQGRSSSGKNKEAASPKKAKSRKTSVTSGEEAT